MTELVRGTDLVGLPVVTLAGGDVAEVRDVMSTEAQEPSSGSRSTSAVGWEDA